MSKSKTQPFAWSHGSVITVTETKPPEKTLPRLWDGTAADRKLLPVVDGAMHYFPDAIAAVSHVSYVGNEQHNPGQPMHWAQGKSSDHRNCIGRHLSQLGTLDTDGIPHSWKLAWRALANLQVELQEQGAPLPPRATKD